MILQKINKILHLFILPYLFKVIKDSNKIFQRKINLILKIFFLGIILTFFQNVCYSQITEGLKTALKSGQAEEIAKYFNDNIEIEILGTDNVYNKEQAKQILKSFFEQHSLISFSILFEGGKNVSQYAIGKLETKKGTFRINLLIKSDVVLQLRIEENNGN